MASYKDYLNGKIQVTKQNISKAVSWLSAAANKRLKRMQARGMRYIYADAPDGEDSIAGHKKFGAKGKTQQQLFSEYKRLKEFFTSEVAGIKEVQQQAKKFNTRVEELQDYYDMREAKAQFDKEMEWEQKERKRTEKEQKDLEQAEKAEESRRNRRDSEFRYNYWKEIDEDKWYNDWLEGVNIYNYLVQTKDYSPSRYDSDQMRDIAWAVAVDNANAGLSIPELAEIALKEFQNQEKRTAEQVKRQRRTRRDTSSFFGQQNK